MKIASLKSFNPFGFIKQKIAPTYLGVDIGTTSIKITEVEQGKKMPRLTNYCMLEDKGSLLRANTAIQASNLKLFENEVVDLLKAAIAEIKPKTMEAVASLPIFSAFTTVLTFPEMSRSDLERSLSFGFKQYIPMPVSEVAIDWMKVGEYRDEGGNLFQEVLLISVPQEQIKKYQRIFKEAGLHLNALEIESLSLVRSVLGNDPAPAFIIDIGSRSTAVIIAEGGTIRFSGQSDFGGASLTQAISSGLNINPMRAEELKREKGIQGMGPNYELSTIMLPFLDAIINEVKRVESNYKSQIPSSKKIERAVLSGGGSNLAGIERYFETHLGIPAVKAAPLAKFEYPPATEPLVRELNPFLSVSLGLVLREFS
ncbi:MAG TPA: type IV pilus assembly protein PilM [Candidatus Paceibacterota bacterium]|nr:type IV pilus assembly protein PilM [Candidatus Paceibacterota bacterium]